MKKKTETLLLGGGICFLGALYYAYEYFLRISPSVMEGALRTHFDLTATGFGFLSACYYYAYVPTQIPAGVLLDRFGPRLLLTSACMACVLGTFLFAETSFAILAGLARALVGFGSAFAFVGLLKLATIWLPENYLALVAGIGTALGVVGAMVGDHLLGAWVVRVGWVQSMHHAAWLGLILAILLWVGIRDKRHEPKHTTLLEGHGTIRSFKKSWEDFLLIIQSKQIWLNGAFGCLVFLPTTVFGELWGIPYLMHTHYLSQASAEMMNSLLFLGLMVGAPMMGYVSDKMAKRRPPMLFGSIGAGFLMLLIMFLPGVTEGQLGVLMFMLGLLYSAQCIVFAVGRELAPIEAAGTAIAVTNMLVMLGAMILQPFLGYLLDLSYSMRLGAHRTHLMMQGVYPLYTRTDYQFAMLIVPIGIFISAFLMLFMKETYANARHHQA